MYNKGVKKKRKMEKTTSNSRKLKNRVETTVPMVFMDVHIQYLMKHGFLFSLSENSGIC